MRALVFGGRDTLTGALTACIAVAIVACNAPAPIAEDAGVGGRGDAGIDAGGAPADDGGEDPDLDGGPADGGTDGGNEPHDLCADAGVFIPEPDGGDACGCKGRSRCNGMGGCTLDCSECSAATPCEDGGICTFISWPTCTGHCVYAAAVCGSGGPAPSTVNVVLVADRCPGRTDVYGCEWRHELLLQSEVVRLGVTVHLTDGGSERVDAGQLTVTEVASYWRQAPAGGLWCMTSGELLAPSCISHSLAIQIQAVAPDAGVVFEYGLGDARRPPALVHKAMSSLMDAAAHSFAAAGYPTGAAP